MCFDNDEFEINNQTTFRFEDCSNGVRREVEFVVNDKLAYSDIVQEFVYFLNAMGYTYIGGLVVLDKDGEEIHQTDI